MPLPPLLPSMPTEVAVVDTNNPEELPEAWSGEVELGGYVDMEVSRMRKNVATCFFFFFFWGGVVGVGCWV